MTVRRLRGLRALALGLLAAGGTLLSSAQAATVRIVDAGSLELRRFEDQELVIISADEDSPGGLVEVELDGETLRARRIEFNRTARTLTLVGGARYASDEGQDLAGEDLVVDLATNSLTGEDVLVSQGKLRIRGEELERVPGQLRAMGSYFTPCGGCGQTPNDYAFQAEQLILYPGDRLVAYRVQLLLADHPVLYLPVIVLPLNEPARQPRLSLGQDERDGFTAAADLPFSVSDHTLGTTLLRYYQNRPARFGVGVDLRSYSPVPYVDRADLYLLTDPKPFEGNQPQEGRDLDLDFSVRGRAPLELATSDLDYDLQVTRRDIGRSATDPLRGVTSVKFGARVEYPLFSAELNLYNLLNRDETRSQYTPLKWPEVVIDPKPYRSGNFSADARLTAGQYTAASNPDSSSASRQGVNITTTRLEEQHDISYSRPLWEGAQFSVRNRFTGRYYGTGARTVDLQAEARLDQRFGVRDQHSLNFTSEYIRYEGTSPFAFDRLSGTRIRAPQTLSLALVPSDGVLLSASHTHDLLADWDQQQATAFGVRINRYPVQLSGHLNHNFYTDTLERFSFSSTLGGQAPPSRLPCGPPPDLRRGRATPAAAGLRLAGPPHPQCQRRLHRSGRVSAADPPRHGERAVPHQQLQRVRHPRHSDAALARSRPERQLHPRFRYGAESADVQHGAARQPDFRCVDRQHQSVVARSVCLRGITYVESGPGPERPRYRTTGFQRGYSGLRPCPKLGTGLRRPLRPAPGLLDGTHLAWQLHLYPAGRALPCERHLQLAGPGPAPQ
ncbi:hypothetical protein [Deinococcus radiophilus]|uniref:hypothetical protein n=1 Tax=Deinococcus radiophilus TaxID=32062 RepID=UPI003622EB78